MKYNKPVVNFQQFVNENAMSNKSPKVKVTYTPSPATPLLNLLHEYGFTLKVHPESDSRRGDNCKEIRVGNDWLANNAFMVTIHKVWTEELVADNYGNDWQEDAEALDDLNTIIGNEEFVFNFFTDQAFSNSPALQEESLRYAHKFYSMYNDEDISSGSAYELFENDKELQFFLNFTGVKVRSNKDIELVRTACYRAYKDHKAMYEADDFFGAHFLDDFKNIK